MKVDDNFGRRVEDRSSSAPFAVGGVRGDSEMVNQDDDFRARSKRVRVKSNLNAPMPSRRRSDADDVDKEAVIGTILRAQLALVLGAFALIAGRGIAINYLMVEPSPETLGIGEGGVVVAMLVAIGLMFGKSDMISHGALVIGASVAFLGESFYIRLFPGPMESIYDPGYVALVFLNAQ